MDDFKEVAYFSLNLFVAAFVITLVVTLSLSIGKMAEIRNAELLAAEQLTLARYYAAYDNQAVTGSDVIALMRENAAKELGLDIAVDRDKNGFALSMTAANSDDATWRLATLAQRIDAGAAYRAILVYDGENSVVAVYTASTSGTVTGVRFSPG